MNATELRGKTAEELVKLQEELLREQFSLNMQKGAGQLAHSSRFKAVRKEIARIKTVMNEATASKD